MSDKVYKRIEVAASSAKSFEHAIEQAVERASRTLKHLSWFEVVEQRGAIRDGRVSEYQVVLRIGFALE